MNWFAIMLLPIVWAKGLAQVPVHPKLAQAKAEYRLAMARHDSLGMAEAAYLMGKRYRTSNDYVSSRQWFFVSLRLREPRGPSVDLNKVYIQLAGDAMLAENYAEAFRYARQALTDSRKLNDPHSLLSAYNMLGILHWQLLEKEDERAIRQFDVSPDSASLYIQQAEPIALRLNQPIDLANVRALKGTMLMVSRPLEAIPLLTYALNYHQAHNSYYQAVRMRLFLAKSHLALHQLAQAHKQLITAKRTCQQNGIRESPVVADGEGIWAEWYKKKGQWEQAFQHLKVADSLRYSILTIEQRATIARLNITYETGRRENLLKTRQAELALSNSRLKQQRQYTVIASALLVLMTVAGFLVHRLSQKNKRISQQNAQLLQEQSHRMKNHLQTISGLLSLQSNRLSDADAKRAVEESQLRVQTMALLHRKLYDTNQFITYGLPTVVPDIVQAILNSYGYNAIQPIYRLDAVPIHVEQVVPVALIINELVTNACKYAFPGQPNPALSVRCWVEQRRIHLRVEDNGPGKQIDAEITGFGLRLIDIQVQQLWGIYAFSGPPGLVFDLSIPIKH